MAKFTGILKVIDGVLLADNVISATKYISPKLVVRATRKRYNKKIRKGNKEVILTVGKPNYAERKFIKLCIKAGEPFPVKKIQYKYVKGK